MENLYNQYMELSKHLLEVCFDTQINLIEKENITQAYRTGLDYYNGANSLKMDDAMALYILSNEAENGCLEALFQAGVILFCHGMYEHDRGKLLANSLLLLYNAEKIFKGEKLDKNDKAALSGSTFNEY